MSSDGISKLCGWKNAVEACNETWDEFLAEFDRQVDSHKAEKSGYPQLIDEAEQCRAAVHEVFTRWRENALERLSNKLLADDQPEHTGPTWSRV